MGSRMKTSGLLGWRIGCILALMSSCALLPTAGLAQGSAELPLSGPAYAIASEAYAAFDRKDYTTAITKAREAIRQRPDVSRLKVLLVAALEASGQVQNAIDEGRKFLASGDADPALKSLVDRLDERVARQHAEAAPKAQPELAPMPEPPKGVGLIASDEERAMAAANQAYQAFNWKDWRNAVAAAQHAVALQPDNQSYRLLLINSLIAAGNRGQAEQAIDQALSRFGNNWELLQKRGYLRQQAKRYGAAASDFASALRSMPETREKRQTRLALADALSEAKQYQLALDALVPLSKNTSYDVSIRKAYALAGLGRKEEAEAAFAEALQTAPSNKQHDIALGARIGLLADLERRDEARSLLDEALRKGQLNTFSGPETAYLASRLGDSKTANAAFQELDSRGKLNGKALIDAAYAAKNQFDNARALELLHRVIDANDAGEITLDPQYAFDLRREAADLSRVWGFSSSVIYGGIGVMPGVSFIPPSGGHTTQTIQELYWRPPVIGYRNGAIFELFVREATTLQNDTNSPVGMSTMQGSVGARWKPLANYNLLLEASRLFPIGRYSRSDVLLRVAYSESRGTDLRVDVPSWWTWSVYGEIGRYVQTNNNIANVLGRAGYSFRLDGISRNLVLTPFIGIDGSYDNSLARKWAWGAGPGVNIRYWFREDKYTAPLSYIDINAQYRFQVAGDDRARGIFAGASIAY